MTLVWIGGLGLIGSICADEAKTRDRGVQTVATVLRVHYGAKGGAEWAEIRFKTRAGRTVETEVDIEAAKDFDERANAVKVRYEPSDPADTVVVAEVDRVSYWLLFAVWGGMVVVLPAMLVRKLAGYGKDSG